MLTGIIMELTIGPMLVGKLGFSVYLFAQVMAATINFGCFFAANLITLPLYTIGLFKVRLIIVSLCFVSLHSIVSDMSATSQDGLSGSYWAYPRPDTLTGILL